MINYISKPFRWFFKLEAASGLVLLFAAIIAFFISNSGLADLYFATLNKYLFIGINNFGLKLSVLHWIFIWNVNNSFFHNLWSEWQDSNLRPSGPKPDALPGCATLRSEY